VQRPDQRLPGGDGQPSGDPVGQLGGRSTRERQHQNAFRWDLAFGDPIGDRFDQGGGLPRARSGQYPERPTEMIDHPALFVGRVDDSVRLRRTAQPEAGGRHRGSSHDQIPSRATDSAREPQGAVPDHLPAARSDFARPDLVRPAGPRAADRTAQRPGDVPEPSARSAP